jgi:prepilin-type processing-associated H-X9-DG protein
MPALTRSKEAGRVVKCASNLRQLQMAALSYATDNSDGKLPHSVSSWYHDWDAQRGSVYVHIHGWVAWYDVAGDALDRQYVATQPAAGRYDWQNATARACITNGVLWSRVRGVSQSGSVDRLSQVYLCPSFAIRTVCGSTTPVRSYSMNASLNGARIYGAAGTSVLFGDDNQVTNGTSAYPLAIRYDGQFTPSNEVGRWHTFTNALAGGQVVYVDGHVERRR